MKDIIATIIGIEGEADEIYREAKTIDSDSDRQYEEAIAQIRGKSDARIKARIAKKEEECRKQYEAKVLEINRQKDMMLQKMSGDFEKNKNNYVEKLYKKALGQ